MTDKNDLANRFFEFEALLRRYNARRMVKSGQGASVHRGQGRLLTLLTMQSEVSQKDLAYVLGMRPQSVGELLGKLEKNDWIVRTPSEEDRRVMLVSLTDKGREEAKKLAEESNSGSEIFEIFSEEEMEQFTGFLDRLIEELAKEVGEDPEDRKAFIERFASRDFLRGEHPHHHGRKTPFEKRFGGEEDAFGRGRKHWRPGFGPGMPHDHPGFGPEFGPGPHHKGPEPEEGSKDEWEDF